MGKEKVEMFNHFSNSVNTLKTKSHFFFFYKNTAFLEKEMATHSSVLAWRLPETEEPGGLPSMGLHRVGHD